MIEPLTDEEATEYAAYLERMMVRIPKWQTILARLTYRVDRFLFGKTGVKS